ncbi:hypothetical protein [Nocardia terpenica]|uniref:Uncharacterized protein n=1 Tax=Nocardia terpenica TaxID=455432 RepID=A0A164K189_9NOCA|nr:hypothetical protein [Nocardia terpenica]KZM70922.1 hypothetical protein AWN90_41080 [Nocardia terpenica]NQE89775.1 hypothetical protein [Nocardia terpenica]
MFNRRERRDRFAAEIREQILAEYRQQLVDAYAAQCLRRFVITLKDGSVVSGVLLEVTTATVVFDDVKLLQEGRDWVPAAGALYVDRAEIRYSQLIDAGGG